MSVPCVLNSAVAFLATSDDDIPPAHTINAFFTYIPSCLKDIRKTEQINWNLLGFF